MATGWAKLTVQALRSWSFGQWGANEGFNLGIEWLRLDLGTRSGEGGSYQGQSAEELMLLNCGAGEDS